MSHARKNWKIDITYSLISAGFYTLLYVILSLLEPGPGFRNSMVARFAVRELFLLAFLVFVIGCVALGFLYCVFMIVLSKLSINEDDASCFALGWVISIPIVLYFSVALGFVSIGVM